MNYFDVKNCPGLLGGGVLEWTMPRTHQ